MQPTFIAAFACLAQLAHGVTVQGYLGTACNGAELYSHDIKHTSHCIKVYHKHAEVQNSMNIAGPFSKGQEVFLYKDADCKKEKTSYDNGVCQFEAEGIKSFKVFESH